jgi:hypothetical protein
MRSAMRVTLSAPLLEPRLIGNEREADMLTISVVLLLCAFVTAVASALGKCPVFVPVILLCLLQALQVIPIR